MADNTQTAPLSTEGIAEGIASSDQTNAGGLPTTGAVVKAPTVKGGFSVPGNVALDPTQTNELLANMQDMIAKRTGGWHDFMSDLQDTMAIVTPPRLGGPTEAMAKRAATKRQEQEDIFNMRAQMASLQGAAKTAEQRQHWVNQILQGGLGGGAAQGQVGATPFSQGVNIPPEIKAAALASADPAGEIQKYLTTVGTERGKKQFDPAWGALTEVIGKTGQIEKVPLWQAVDLAVANPNNPTNRAVIQVAREIPGAPPSLGAAAATAPQGTAEDIARSLGVPLTSGTRSFDKQAEMYAKSQEPGYTGPVVAKPTTSRHVSGYAIDVDMKKATDADLQKLRDAGFKQTVKGEPWHWELPQGKPTAVAAAPTGTVTDVGGGDLPPRAMPGESPESLKMRQTEWQKDREARRAGLKTQTEDTTKFIDSLTSAGEAANTKLGMLREIKDAAINHPDDFYVSGNTKGKYAVMGGLVNYARDQGGEQKAKDREKSLQPYFFSQDSIKRRENIDAYSGQLAMGSSREMLGDASVRLGAQIEKMFIDFKGLGTAMPAETNRKAAEMYEVIMERKRDQANAAKDYLKSHPTATPTEIMNSPAYKAVDDRASERLVKLFGKAAEVSPQDMAREELRRRKEAQQGAK